MKSELEPEQKLRLGIIGLGGAARQMLPSLEKSPFVEISSAVDLRSDARAQFENLYHVPAYETIEDMCTNSDIDAVYIATPHQFHKENAVEAASFGKHMIVEKPMALTLEDCDEMIEAADQNNVFMVIGHTHSFNPPIQKMREIVRSGSIGFLSMIHTFNYSNFLYKPRRPEELDTSKGGGILFNQVPHQVDIVRLLGGGLVRSVRSMTRVLDTERPTEGSHLTFLEFEDGTAASMVYSGYDFFDSDEFHGWVGEGGEKKQENQHGKTRAALQKLTHPDEEAEIKALTGSRPLRGGDASNDLSFHYPHCGVTLVSCSAGDMRPSADGIWIYDKLGRREISVGKADVYPYKSGVVEELYHSIVLDRKPLHDGRWGKATMEVCLAIEESSKQRREIYLEYQVPTND